MIEIERVMMKLRAGVITVQAACRMLWELIFRNRKLFLLGSLTEDQLQDFLIYLHERLPFIICRYTPERGCFFNFLFIKTRMHLKSWKRREIKHQAGTESCKPCYTVEFSSRQDQYNNSEAFCVADSFNHSIRELQQLVSRPKVHETIRKGSHRKNPLACQNRIENMRRESVLILALKSCTDMTEEILERTSILTGIDRDRLTDMIEKARETLSTKYERNCIYRRIRDNAFFYHRRFLIESLCIKSEYASSRTMKIKYDRQTAAWKTALEKLKSTRFLLRPSTKTVAAILGLNVRHVEYVLKHMNRNMDKIRLKWYPHEHENISCNRKFK